MSIDCTSGGTMYAVPGDDGTREEGKAIYICSCIYSPEGCNPPIVSIQLSNCSSVSKSLSLLFLSFQ